MMRVLFPVEIHSDKATYDIAFGNIERPNHKTTSYDRTKFEVSGHKWVDLSEGDYGVALMNDCKYGYTVNGKNMQLSLLRSATFPDAQADRDSHEFSYYMYPHKDGLRKTSVVQSSYEMNVPLIFIKGRKKTLEYCYISIDKENVIIDIIKRAEDSEDIIIRVYEAYNNRGYFGLEFSFDVAEVYESDLLESNLNETEAADNTIKSFKISYKMETFRVIVK